MIGLPPLGAKVKIWPLPGRMVQDGPRTLDSGGRWLPSNGKVVKWTPFHLEQLRAGDLLLHAPPCAEHDFSTDGNTDGCANCGRSKDHAAEYDVHAVPARAKAAAQSEKQETASGELFDVHAATEQHMKDIAPPKEPVQPEKPSEDEKVEEPKSDQAKAEKPTPIVEKFDQSDKDKE